MPRLQNQKDVKLLKRKYLCKQSIALNPVNILKYLIKKTT